jgi:hypothetical protein
LISSSHIFLSLVFVDGSSDFLTLRFNIYKDSHGLVVKTLGVIIIADLLADVSGNLLVADSGSFL